jgi:hypothetical protein
MFPIQISVCSETCEVTIRANDLGLIQSIKKKIRTENLKCSATRGSNYEFLDVLPESRKEFGVSMEDGVACLTFRCKDMRRYNIFRCTLSEHFEIEREYNQHNCTIVGFSKPNSSSSIFEKVPSVRDRSLSKLEKLHSAIADIASGQLVYDLILPEFK